MTPDQQPLRSFAISVELIGQRAQLGLRGDLEGGAVSELRSLFETLEDNRYRSVIVDLSGIGHVGADGIHLLAEKAIDQAPGGGPVSLRSPSDQMRDLLEAAGVEILAREFVAREFADPRPGSLRPDPGPGPTARPMAAASHRGESADHLRELAGVTALPAPDDVVDGTLRLVVALAQATIGGADGASVSLRRNGQLSTVAATDQTILDMDANQYATGEGPCVDASVKGRWFHSESLTDESRWPEFTPKAHALGINAILSSPLLAFKEPVGALNIYARAPSAFSAADQRLASTFASEASHILTDAHVDLTGEQRSARFRDALQVRQVIAQAQGVIMEREGISEDDAYTVLRIFSQRSGRSLFSRAEEIIASTWKPQYSFRPELPDGPDKADAADAPGEADRAGPGV
jgi:anti-anti-sigma regulatory factor